MGAKSASGDGDNFGHFGDFFANAALDALVKGERAARAAVTGTMEADRDHAGRIDTNGGRVTVPGSVAVVSFFSMARGTRAQTQASVPASHKAL